MIPNHLHYEVSNHDRRERYEASARKHRLLGAVRRHRSVAVDGTTSVVAVPSISPGRTPGGIDRQAA